MARHYGHVFEGINVGKKNPVSVERTNDVSAYIDSVRKIKKLTEEEEIELGHRIMNSQRDSSGKSLDRDSINKLVNANLGFVISVAKQYAHCGSCLSVNDLINEGNLGLMQAAESFDPTRGFKFISYAVHYIRMHITKALEKKSRIVSDYHSGVSNRHSSLDATIDDDGDTTLGDMICTSTDAESFRDENLKNDIMRVLNKLLKPKEVMVICFTFGINTPRKELSKTNIREIMAKSLDMTTERVRQIEQEAITKIQNNKQAIQLLLKYCG
jgi:RNA polymerase primary sigma factor